MENTISREKSGYDLLARPVQKWIYQQGWQSLRDIQEQATHVICANEGSGGDAIIAAATASGKTEAAFLPLISRIISQTNKPKGFDVIYISPIKALINDQYRRLETLCEAVDMPVHKWHGDVAQSAKTKARTRPDGVLLITPESLEALLMRRGNEVFQLVSGLNGIVIDELHAFIGSERGVQLQSLLHRIDVIAERKINRFGLSATLGDMQLAAEALRPGFGSAVTILESQDEHLDVQTTIRGYINPIEKNNQESKDGLSTGKKKKKKKKTKFIELYKGAAGQQIAEHLFETMHGKPNLIFAGSKSNVETFADLLRSSCESHGIANEFFPHHGNLSKESREFVEQRLRETGRPTTAIATSTLEMGIDIGDVETVAQIGAPFTVSALRQRVGRAGRREGQSAILNMYCAEQEDQVDASLPFRLRLRLLQSIATLSLLKKGWCEPPLKQGWHLSTLLHQIITSITQYGGLSAKDLYALLCQNGSFHTVEPALFGALLRSMGSGKKTLIEQSDDGSLLLSKTAERLTSHFSIYGVFKTSEQYKVIANGKNLGVLETMAIPKLGEGLIFLGRRWVLQKIDTDGKSIHLTPSTKGVARLGGANFGDIHDKILAEMALLYQSNESLDYLDETAQKLLKEARTNFAEIELDKNPIQVDGSGLLLFPWVGSIQKTAFVLALQNYNLKVFIDGEHYISINDCSMDRLQMVLEDMANAPAPDPLRLAEFMPEHHLRREKYDGYIAIELLQKAFAHERINAAAIPQLAKKLIS